ncbi:MAG: ATP-binding cassette domain-containing protein [Lachnospiraceae bacterium]|nr:ATP-binding cassette domain-containing protein [Lachnospiraceae bacterium]
MQLNTCSLFFEVLVSIGYMMIFKKCGIKLFWAFIPFAREYQISRCSDRENEGRVYAFFSGMVLIMQVVFNFLSDYPYLVVFLAIPYLVLYIGAFVYAIRVYTGLTEVFGRSKKWAVLFVLFEGITVLIWGFSKKFQPVKELNLIDKEGAKVFGKEVRPENEGLSVNITERTATDFFKKKTLLKDIHMNIPKGHMVLLLGGSGAGKTTFVNAVTGYEKANAKILLNDRNIYTEYSRMLFDIGFVPQQDLMRGTDTVKLTLSDAASLRLPSGVSRAERKERIENVLNEFGLKAIENSLVDKLSGGQRKRLSIAMEYISDPSLFILDEPDSGLDGVVARGLFEKLRAIADEGKIVVVITHTPDRVIDLFDDVIVLAKDASRTGRLAWYGPVDEVYEFFGKKSMEEILLSVNQKDEGGEGRADEFVEKYADYMQEKAG